MKKLIFCLIFMMSFSGVSWAIGPHKIEEFPSLNGWKIERLSIFNRVFCSATKKQQNIKFSINYGEPSTFEEKRRLNINIIVYNRKLPNAYRGPVTLLLSDNVSLRGKIFDTGIQRGDGVRLAIYVEAVFENVEKYKTKLANSKQLVIRSDDQVMAPVVIEDDFSDLMKTLETCYEDGRLK